MVENIIKKRRSIVCFDSKEVENEILRKLFEMAKWAPSAFNRQPWRFIVGKNNSETYHKIFSALEQGNQIWAKNAPVLFTTIAETINHQRNTSNRYAWHDSALAFANLTFMATSLGLYVHPMAGFSSQSLIDGFKIPSGFEPVTVAALGYKSDCSNVPESVAERDSKERTRKSLSEFVFSDNWNSPFKF
ncbi:MAG: nitroreductase family protein [Bacteroidales bacterium]|nr:nitroreductase family protein [Bacteroidales bacterium]MBN2820206.1 nitroreductase family protein [Bacteroidales bacterium]